MIGLEDRRMKVRNIEAAQHAGARLDAACKVAGITLRTLQRWKRADGLLRGDLRPVTLRARPAHALPPRQNSCRLDKILNSGAMVRERRGAIRTRIQG